MSAAPRLSLRVKAVRSRRAPFLAMLRHGAVEIRDAAISSPCSDVTAQRAVRVVRPFWSRVRAWARGPA